MSKPNVVKRMNNVIQSPEVKVIDLTGQTDMNDVSDYNKFKNLDSAHMTSALQADMKYFTKKGEEMNLKSVTNWLVVDFTSEQGRNIIRDALKQVV